MVKAKQTSLEAAAIIAADKLQVSEQPGGAPAAVAPPATAAAAPGEPVVGDIVQVAAPGNEAFADLRDQLAPPAPVRRERFKAVSNVLIDGEGAEAGGSIWLTEGQFDELRPLGAIEGEWPD